MTIPRKLFLEQAIIHYDELGVAAKNAPCGKILKNGKALAVVKGRELLRQSLENVVTTTRSRFRTRRAVVIYYR